MATIAPPAAAPFRHDGYVVIREPKPMWEPVKLLSINKDEVQVETKSGRKFWAPKSDYMSVEGEE